MTRRLPLELKLPLLISGLLATVLAIALFATYSALRTTALDRASDRLRGATRQIAIGSAAQMAVRGSTYTAVAHDPLVKRALQGERVSQSTLLAVLNKVSVPADTGLPAELWTSDGRRIASTIPAAGALRLETGQPELRDRIATPLPNTAGSDSLRVGPIYVEPDRGAHLWIVKPIVENRRTLGFLTHKRRIAIPASAQRTLRDLSGDSVSMYYRNADGSLWASALGPPMEPIEDIDTTLGTARLASGERVLAREERLAGTPLIVGMYVPERGVVARPAATFRRMLMFSALLLLGGIIAAWAIGRSVGRPLVLVTEAAGSVASGRYDARVPVKGDPEIRRLAESFNHMAEEIGRARAELEQQTREAHRANNAKSEFLTTMSHELRTPLNAIGGYVDLISMELRGPVTAAQKRDLERIKTSQQHLLGLISAVLDLARVEAGKTRYDIVSIPIDTFLSDIDSLIAPQASAKSVKLEHVASAPMLVALADREKLRQIVLNLLSNAVRHTPAGGTITISAEARGDVVAVIVADTGPGIPSDKREEIFEPFVQLDRSLTQLREGLGLGLAISRDLARGMSGDLRVEPQGEGARFVLTMPRGTFDPDRPIERTGEMAALSRG